METIIICYRQEAARGMTQDVDASYESRMRRVGHGRLWHCWSVIGRAGTSHVCVVIVSYGC